MQPHARPTPAELCVVLDGRRKVVCLDCNVNLRRHGRDVFVDHGGKIDEWCETRPVRVVAVEPVAVVVEPATLAVPAVAVEPATEPSRSLSPDDVALLLAVRADPSGVWSDATPTTQESPMPNRPTAPDTLPNGVRLEIPPGVGGIADIVAANHPAPAMPAPVAEAREAAVVCAACRRAANTMKGRICATCQSRAHTLWGTWTPTDEQIGALPKAWETRRVPKPAALVPDQPTPTPALGDVWGDVINAAREEDRYAPLIPLMQERRALGIERYGTPLQRENGRDHDTDAAQELLDATVYCYAGGRNELATRCLDLLLVLRGPFPGDPNPDLTQALKGAEWLIAEVLLQTGATREEVLDCMNAEGHKPVLNRAAGREHADLAAIDEALSLSGEGRTRYEGDRLEVVKHLLSELAATGRTLDQTRAASQHSVTVLEEANRDLLVEFKATHRALERAGYAPNSYIAGMPDAVDALEESRNRFRERCDEATARADGEASRANAMRDELGAIDAVLGSRTTEPYTSEERLRRITDMKEEVRAIRWELLAGDGETVVERARGLRKMADVATAEAAEPTLLRPNVAEEIRLQYEIDAIDKVWGWTDAAAEPSLWRAQKISARLGSDATTIAALQRNCDEMAANLRAALAEVYGIDAAMGWQKPAVAPGWRAEKIIAMRAESERALMGMGPKPAPTNIPYDPNSLPMSNYYADLRDELLAIDQALGFGSRDAREPGDRVHRIQLRDERRRALEKSAERAAEQRDRLLMEPGPIMSAMIVRPPPGDGNSRRAIRHALHDIREWMRIDDLHGHVTAVEMVAMLLGLDLDAPAAPPQP